MLAGIFNTDQIYFKGFKNQEVPIAPFERQTLKLQKM
jgi:hypothetical protein